MATARLEFSPLYGFVRSRQLEGTFPGDASMGVYGSTTFRVKRGCGHDLHGEDPTPLIHQVADLPNIEPVVDQYRLHRLTCPDCGVTNLDAAEALARNLAGLEWIRKELLQPGSGGPQPTETTPVPAGVERED